MRSLFNCMVGRKTDQNLIPTNKRSKSEARELGRKGGIASGVARREKKTMAQTLELFLSMPIKDGDLANIESLKSLAGAKGENISVQEGIVLAQTLLALKGDSRAAAFIRELVRDAETQQQEAGVTIVDDFK